MKKIFLLMLSIIIVISSISVYADARLKKIEKEVDDEINLEQRLGILIKKSIKLYLELDPEGDEELMDELIEELRTGFKIMVSEDPDEDDMEGCIEALDSMLLEYEKEVEDYKDNKLSQKPFKDSIKRPNLPSTWQPWEWKGWEKFPSLYFAAEPEGYMSPKQMKKVSKFSLAILEFRMGQWVEEETTGKWAGGDLAGFMEDQAKRIKKAYPDAPPILVYRSGMWAGSMFKKQWEALQNQKLFLKDSRMGEGFINYPMDVDESGFETDLKYCRWDFRKPETRKVYQSLIKSAAKEDTSGVFFDNAQSVASDGEKELSRMSFKERKEFMESQLEAYTDAFSTLVNNNKYPILSTTNGFSDIGALVPWENDCPRGEEAIIEALEGIPFARNNEFWMWNLGETAAKQIRNAIRETENGIPIIVHMPYFSKDGGCLDGAIKLDGSKKIFTKDEFLEFGIAAFLVSMGEGSYFGFSDMQSDPEGAGWFDVSWEYHDQYDDIITGKPIGDVRVSNDGMTFTRTFENGTVWVNCADGTYSIDLNKK
ncbi:putative glycoside hydrolase [Wukongibacter baidiensis]|uniref:putative glycoside hydrolase n=1 Tax=Wukongibacter baidiensis TaxID=1723361 RepID=UPI003D7F3953